MATINPLFASSLMMGVPGRKKKQISAGPGYRGASMGTPFGGATPMPVPGAPAVGTQQAFIPGMPAGTPVTGFKARGFSPLVQSMRANNQFAAARNAANPYPVEEEDPDELAVMDLARRNMFRANPHLVGNRDEPEAPPTRADFMGAHSNAIAGRNMQVFGRGNQLNQAGSPVMPRGGVPLGPDVGMNALGQGAIAASRAAEQAEMDRLTASGWGQGEYVPGQDQKMYDAQQRGMDEAYGLTGALGGGQGVGQRAATGYSPFDQIAQANRAAQHAAYQSGQGAVSPGELKKGPLTMGERFMAYQQKLAMDEEAARVPEAERVLRRRLGYSPMLAKGAVRGWEPAEQQVARTGMLNSMQPEVAANEIARQGEQQSQARALDPEFVHNQMQIEAAKAAAAAGLPVAPFKPFTGTGGQKPGPSMQVEPPAVDETIGDVSNDGLLPPTYLEKLDEVIKSNEDNNIPNDPKDLAIRDVIEEFGNDPAAAARALSQRLNISLEDALNELASWRSYSRGRESVEREVTRANELEGYVMENDRQMNPLARPRMSPEEKRQRAREQADELRRYVIENNRMLRGR